MRFVDSNVFVYHLSAEPRYGETASRILARIERGEEATTSTLIIHQVVSYLRWKKRADSVPKFLGFLQSLSSLRKMETSFEDFIEASKQIEGEWNAFDDHVVARQMGRAKVEEIYSNDSDFDRIRGVRRVFE